MSEALSLTPCWDIWEIKYGSCYCARACALPTGTVCAFERRKKLSPKEDWENEEAPRVCVPLKGQTAVFPPLALCARCASVLLPGRRAAQSGSWGGIRSLRRATVARLKFTRTAGNRRPFIDCSFSTSRALSSRNRSDDPSREISCVIAQLSARLKQLGVMRKPSAR